MFLWKNKFWIPNYELQDKINETASLIGNQLHIIFLNLFILRQDINVCTWDKLPNREPQKIEDKVEWG